MVTLRSKPATKSAVSQAKISVEKSVPIQSPTSPVARATQPAAKPLSGTIAKLKPKPKTKPKTEKPVKVKKLKLIRDKFKIPKVEYAVLEELKDRATKLGCPAKKSELLRAGVKALAALPGGAFRSALSVLPTVKVGGPKKDKT
jgi:hypothetical protein